MHTSANAALIGSVFLAAGLVCFVYAESERIKSPIQFSHGGKAWNISHYLSFAFFTVSAALYVVWYMLKEREDRQ